MLLSELMKDIVPKPAFAGATTADDYILAIDLAATPASNPSGYFVAQEGITEHSGSLNAQTQESQYIRSGKVTTRTGAQRQFKVAGDRHIGDAFQDGLLAHKIKYGTGQSVIKDYVYFNILTGIGEKGQVSISVEDDPSGGAGANASFTATLSTRSTPEEYTYSKTNP